MFLGVGGAADAEQEVLRGDRAWRVVQEAQDYRGEGATAVDQGDERTCPPSQSGE